MGNYLKGKHSIIVMFLVILLIAFLPMFGLSLYMITFLFILMMNIALTVGWNILGGYAGYVSFGHVAFVGTGGYTTAILLDQLGWSPIVTTPLAGIIAALIALIIGFPTLSLRGPYFSVATLIISLALGAFVLNFPGINTAAGIYLSPPGKTALSSTIILFYMMMVVLIITMITAYFIEHSKFGLGLTAIREDEEVAATQGVNTTNVKLIAFVISGGLAGMVGGIFAWYQGVLYVNAMFNINLSVMIVLMAIIGGTRSWIGVTIGATLVTIINEILTLTIGSNLSQIIFGILLALTMLYLPDGIIGLLNYKIRPAKKILANSSGGDS